MSDDTEKTCSICKKVGEFRKTNKMCNSCIDKNKCEHGKQRRLCKECGRSAYCEHDKRKELCAQCGGTGLCKEHGNRKDKCRKCPNAAAYCIHKKNKYSCVECGNGSQLCIHKNKKTECKLCGGKNICEHNKIIDNCVECKGCNICEHGKRRVYCKECGGSLLCIHDKSKYDCSDCKLVNKFCEHGTRRRTCKDCKGAGLCPHLKQHIQCILCNPQNACLNCKMYYVAKQYRFHPYCFSCYCVLHPDADIPHRYKLKEHHMTEYLKDEFKEIITMVFDKVVEGGCSKRRPDVRIDMGTHSIMIECDENQHRGYNCETKRMMELFEDCGSRPIVFLRINPDGYTYQNTVYPSCFRSTNNGLSVDKKEFERRMKMLVERIEYFKNNFPQREVIVEEYCYTE